MEIAAIGGYGKYVWLLQAAAKAVGAGATQGHEHPCPATHLPPQPVLLQHRPGPFHPRPLTLPPLPAPLHPETLRPGLESPRPARTRSAFPQTEDKAQQDQARPAQVARKGVQGHRQATHLPARRVAAHGSGRSCRRGRLSRDPKRQTVPFRGSPLPRQLREGSPPRHPDQVQLPEVPAQG